MLGGWSSGNRYSLLGSLRSAAQMVSYETSLGLALSGTLMWAGTLSMVGIIHTAARPGHLVHRRPATRLCHLLIAGVAEVNRAPFDLPEAEQELTAGYLTEYSGLRWSLYQMAEYINMITVSAVASTLFLGGWSFFGLERIPGRVDPHFPGQSGFLPVSLHLAARHPAAYSLRPPDAPWLAVTFATCSAQRRHYRHVVALGLVWWVNGLAWPGIIIVVLLIIRRRSGELQKVGPAQGTGLPSSVRLAKFGPIEVANQLVAPLRGNDATA